MSKFEWKNLISTIAPTIATAFGGPLAGVATSAISKAVLGKSDGTDEELNNALIATSPEMLVKIKEVDEQFKIRMQELSIDLEKISFENVKDARNREIEIAKLQKPDHTPKILAYLAIIGFFVILYALFVRTLPEGLPRDAFLILMGTLTKIVGDLYNYYFGSSAGSARKTDMIHETINNNNGNK